MNRFPGMFYGHVDHAANILRTLFGKLKSANVSVTLHSPIRDGKKSIARRKSNRRVDTFFNYPSHPLHPTFMND